MSSAEYVRREHGGCVEAVREVTLSLAPPCTRRATHIGQELEVPCKPPRASTCSLLIE
jgi:hypothetical protein